MANTLKLKRSATPSKIPTTSDLELGELAYNTYDGKLYAKKDNGTASIVEIGGGGSGSGDVTGPSSATDNAIARFDGTTGKLIQNGTVTQDDNGNLANVNAVSFDTTPATLPSTTGSMFWDSGNGTPSIILDPDVTLQLGQEMLALVYNGTGSTITNGSVVAVTGAQGQRPSVSLADADSESLSAPTLGIATEDIANGAEGFVTTFGFVRGLDTSSFTAGLPIYLSQTAGQFTQTRPSAPAHTVALGWVIKVNASSGEVFVNINNGWELDELHNVLITSPSSGNTLIYDATAGVWENANLTAGSGISITNGAGSIDISVSSSVVTTTGSQTLSNKQFQAYNETVTTVGTVSGSTYNIDLSLSNIFDITLGNNVTFTFTNPPASGIAKNCTIILRQDATGSRTATFTNAKYTDGTAPILSTGANQIDVLTFFTLNGGSFWFGTYAMANVS